MNSTLAEWPADSPAFRGRARRESKKGARLVRLLSRDDVHDVLGGTFEVADRELYVIRPEQIRWISENVRQLHLRCEDQASKAGGTAAVDLMDMLDLSSPQSRPEREVRERVLVRYGLVVPNFSFFVLSKPWPIGLVDIVVVGFTATLGLMLMDAAVAAIAVGTWVAIRELANASIRHIIRRERKKHVTIA